MISESEQRRVEKIRRELGIVLPYLEDDTVIEIMLNDDSSLWIERLGEDMEKVGEFPPAQAKALMSTIATVHDTTITPDNPILECELPIDGSRFEAIIPPIVQRPIFTIRKKAISIFTLEDYCKQGIMSENQVSVIKKSIADRKNILVVGGTGSGKTTLINAIIDAIKNITPKHRLLILEDTAELQSETPNRVFLRSNKNTTLLRLSKATLRLRPDRILVGEVRGGEALELLKNWNTGHPGGVATVHANSAAAGLSRIEQLIAEVSPTPMPKLIADAINIIVFIEKTADGSGRRVREILSLDGYDPIKQQYMTKNII